MVVSIKFLGMQRIVTNTDSVDMPITENTRVNDALQLVTVNLEAASLNRILRDKDTVSFLPLIAGG
jgi:molybdopterin converting factor small subunit